jgi:GR25 family glycosyltransferase involved in LPS biosynthesis
MKTFIISLKHETARRQYMENVLNTTNITDFSFIDAVYGMTDLHKYNFKVMPDWVDPIEKRKINVNEIGCFLSHYSIWKQIIDNNIDVALILEDDCVFKDDFNTKFTEILQIDTTTYDYFTLGRNRNNNLYSLGPEIVIENDYVIPKYSYNAHSYLLTNAGAKILANDLALEYIIPVDEYIPLMHNSFPFPKYSDYFKNMKKLRAIGLVNDIVSQRALHILPSSVSNRYIPEYICNTHSTSVTDQTNLKITTQHLHMEQTLRIFDNFLDDALYNECYEYSTSRFESPEMSLRTNLSWNQNIRKDSNLVLTHILSTDNDLYKKINDIIKTKCQVDSIKNIMFYYWTQGSHIPWHNDGCHNGGITIYLNKVWDEDWGGIFLFKDDDTINGFYPKQNRSVMQLGGIPHSVAPTTKNSDIRFTIQIFF